MNLLNWFVNFLKLFLAFAVRHGGKAFAALVAFLVGAPTVSNAAVTFDESTGFGGAIDLTFFYSAVPLVVVAIVAVLAVTLGIKMFKRV